MVDLSLCNQDMSSTVLCDDHVNSSVMKINGVKLSAAASMSSSCLKDISTMPNFAVPREKIDARINKRRVSQPRIPHSQSRHQELAYRHRDHWRSSHRTSYSTPPVCAPWSVSRGTNNYNDPWFWYSPWMFHDIPYSSSALRKGHNIYDRLSWPFQEYCFLSMLTC